MAPKEIITVELPMRYQKNYGFKYEIQYTGGWKILEVIPGGAIFFSMIEATDKIIAVDDVKVTCWNFLKIDELFQNAVKHKRTLTLIVQKGPGVKKSRLDKVAKRVRRASTVLKKTVSSVHEERKSLVNQEEDLVDVN